jgi:CubicO group peptidase (beta-lactamase class C family)
MTLFVRVRRSGRSRLKLVFTRSFAMRWLAISHFQVVDRAVSGTKILSEEIVPLKGGTKWSSLSSHVSGDRAIKFAKKVTKHIRISRGWSFVSASVRARVPHRGYSVTKAVIGTVTAIAWKDGVLDSLNHRVLDFFDPRSIANVDQKKEAITVQNLLDMTSGLEWTEQVGGLTPPIETDRQMAASVDWVKFILDRPMSSAPGDTFNYDSGNPHLLSAILTKLTGMSTLDYAKAKLFGPLGIKDKDVLWLPDQQGISNGGWGLYLQPRDMAKIGYLYLHNGVWEGKQLLPPEWVNKVSHPTAETHLKGFWYSNFFWVLPDKHVYMAVGRYGPGDHDLPGPGRCDGNDGP